MKPFTKSAQWLDRIEFLHIRLWEFSLRNTKRFFSWYFLLRILLLHPLKAIRGLQQYRNLVINANKSQLNGSSNFPQIQKLLLTKSNHAPRFLIAFGFCMKPYDEDKGKTSCPVGHFNHNCIVLENSSLRNTNNENWPSPCKECTIGTLVQHAAKIRADFYIMTSALDIARDLFLPAIRGKGAQTGVFLLCPYSAEAFTLGMTTCGIHGTLITFCKGDCLNHQDFTLADKGFKTKQTFIEASLFKTLLGDFQTLNAGFSHTSAYSIHYKKVKNVYRYQS